MESATDITKFAFSKFPPLLDPASLSKSNAQTRTVAASAEMTFERRRRRLSSPARTAKTRHVAPSE